MKIKYNTHALSPDNISSILEILKWTSRKIKTACAPTGYEQLFPGCRKDSLKQTYIYSPAGAKMKFWINQFENVLYGLSIVFPTKKTAIVNTETVKVELMSFFPFIFFTDLILYGHGQIRNTDPV